MQIDSSSSATELLHSTQLIYKIYKCVSPGSVKSTNLSDIVTVSTVSKALSPFRAVYLHNSDSSTYTYLLDDIRVQWFHCLVCQTRVSRFPIFMSADKTMYFFAAFMSPLYLTATRIRCYGFYFARNSAGYPICINEQTSETSIEIKPIPVNSRYACQKSVEEIKKVCAESVPKITRSPAYCVKV